MINFIQKSLGRLVTQKRFHFLFQPFLITKNKASLNDISSMQFSIQKQFKYFTFDDFGITDQLDGNFSENLALQEWHKEIITQIQKYSNITNDKEMIDFLLYIQDFYQTYMNSQIKNPELIIQIDKKISDFLKIELQDKVYCGELQKNYMHLVLYKLRIQTIFLQNFETLELSLKITLYSQYQYFHLKTLELEGTDLQMIKIKSCFSAQTLFIILAQKWKQYEEDEKKYYFKQIELVKYALDQLLKIFDELQTVNIEDQQKINLVSNTTNRINFILDSFNMYAFLENYELIYNILINTEKAFEEFKNIIPFEEYIQKKQDFILQYINLGQNDKALQSAQDIYDLRSQFSTKFAIQYYISFYYCLRKTGSKCQALDNLIQTINLQDLDEEAQNQYNQLTLIQQLNLLISQLQTINLQELDEEAKNQYNQLILIQQLNKLISEQKYEELQPIFTKIISLPFQTLSQKQLLLPLLCETVILHPQIPNHQENSKHLLSFLANEDLPIDSIYLTILRDIQRSMLLYKVSLVYENKTYTAFSLIMIQHALENSKGDARVEREIIKSVIKLIPKAFCDKSYALFIDNCISHLQKNKEKQDNIDLLEILKQQKINLDQKYGQT